MHTEVLRRPLTCPRTRHAAASSTPASPNCTGAPSQAERLQQLRDKVAERFDIASPSHQVWVWVWEGDSSFQNARCV